MESSSTVRFDYSGSLALVGVMLLVLACGEESTAPPGPRAIDALPRELSLAERDLIAADNAFGLKLFREIHAQADEGENLFISPLSVALALTMTYNGAEGTTADAFRETLEYELKMNDVLTVLGLGVAFGGGANFDGICPSCGLFISLVLHKSYVSVHEEGTTAAAATMVMLDRARSETFEVDRPFLFAIRERYSGAILFLGLVKDPS